MIQICSSLALALILVLSGCGNDNAGPKGGNAIPINSKTGWTAELIERLIACQPNPSTECDCIIPKVTAKYTPEQVKEKSPYVASDMLIIKGQCEHHDSPVSNSSPAKPSSYPSIKGQNCETGEHRFTNFESLCEGLQSDKLNNRCALEERQAIFYKAFGCSGPFQQKP